MTNITDTFHAFLTNSFLRNALILSSLSAISFGIMGSYVVVKRISYLAGAISHSILGGIGIALYLQNVYHISWMTPLLGAFSAAIIATLIISIIDSKANERMDSVIGAIWVIGMAIGVIFISKTPGYNDPLSYLFGDILLVSSFDIKLVIGLDILVVILMFFFYHNILAVCFDEEFAKLRGIKTSLYNVLLLLITAIAIVLMVRIVGIVLVIALLTLPAATANHFTNKFWKLMLLSIIFSFLFIVSGLFISYPLDLPSGAVIIILAGGVYLLTLIILAISKNFKKRKLKQRNT